VKTWIDFDDAPVFEVPLTDEFDGVGAYQGMLIEGPQGWGEFSAPRDCDDAWAARWLTAAIEAGTVGWPDPLRGRVPVAVTVPEVGPDRARQIVVDACCRTAAVRIGGRADSAAADIARLEAVRDTLGSGGNIRCTTGVDWDPEATAAVMPALERAARGLEFIQVPGGTPDENSTGRTIFDIPFAIEVTHPAQAAGADIAVLNVNALGGVRRALRVAEVCGLPCVVTAGLASSVGIAAGLALAGVLPDIGLASELATARLLTGDVVSPGRRLIPVDGYLPVAPMPAAPDTIGLDRCAVTDPVTVTWWRNRLRNVQRHI
jgi:O-succinylbenzoate synthase